MRRHALSSFFSKRSVMEYAHSMQSCVENLCVRLEAFHTSQSPINLRIIFFALTIDMISLCSFGRSYKCLEKSDFDLDLYQLITSTPELALLLKQFPWMIKIADLLPYSLVVRLSSQIKHGINLRRVTQPQSRIALEEAKRVPSTGS